MKKRILYSKDNITFWPLYSAGKIGMIFVQALAVLAISTRLLEIFDDTSRPIPWHSALFPLAVLFVSFFILIYIRRVMHQKYVVSHVGIEISNPVTNKNEKYLWSDIASVCFRRDGWYGRKTLLVWLKESPNIRLTVEPLYDIMISADGLDINILLEFIPSDLYRNNPKMAWP